MLIVIFTLLYFSIAGTEACRADCKRILNDKDPRLILLSGAAVSDAMDSVSRFPFDTRRASAICEGRGGRLFQPKSAQELKAVVYGVISCCEDPGAIYYAIPTGSTKNYSTDNGYPSVMNDPDPSHCSKLSDEEYGFLLIARNTSNAAGATCWINTHELEFASAVLGCEIMESGTPAPSSRGANTMSVWIGVVITLCAFLVIV